MVRVFGSFLALFGLLGLLVRLYGLAFLFGGTAAALLVIDLLLAKLATGSRASRTRMGSVL